MDNPELEKRLLDVYPEARAFLAAVKGHNNLAQVHIENRPHKRFKDQREHEGPFWSITSERAHSEFRGISFGLNPDHYSLAWGRENASTGRIITYREDYVRAHLRDYPEKLIEFYRKNFQE